MRRYITREEYDEINKLMTGKYGTYEELSKKYEDLWKDYLFVSKMLTDVQERMLQQNRTLEKFHEAYKYIIEEDQD